MKAKDFKLVGRRGDSYFATIMVRWWGKWRRCDIFSTCPRIVWHWGSTGGVARTTPTPENLYVAYLAEQDRAALLRGDKE